MNSTKTRTAALLTAITLSITGVTIATASPAQAKGPICDIVKDAKGKAPRVQHWSTKRGMGPWLLKAVVDIKCKPAKDVAALQGDLIIQRWEPKSGEKGRWVKSGDRASEQGKASVRIWANGLCVKSGKYRWLLDVDAIGAPGVLNNRAHDVPGPISTLKCPPLVKP